MSTYFYLTPVLPHFGQCLSCPLLYCCPYICAIWGSSDTTHSGHLVLRTIFIKGPSNHTIGQDV